MSPLADHYEGGSVARAIRAQLGFQTDIRKERTLQADNLKKSASSDKAPQTGSFQDALEQASRLMKNPGSVSAGDIHEIRAERLAEEAAAGRGEVNMDAL